MKPIVSIITPTYNHERYIATCIESVIKQTFQDWELIIIDDYSIDTTGEIIKKYLWDKRIKYIRHKENYGKEKLYITHNEALALCNGQFITILEGDDYWPEYRLEIQINTFKKREIVLCHGEIAYDIKGEIIYPFKKKRWSTNILKNEPLGSILKPFLYGENVIYSQSVMVKKDILNKIGGFKQWPSLYLVDYPTWIEIALYGKFYYIPEILGYWRRHLNSITLIYEEELWEGIASFLEEFVNNKKNILLNLPVNLEKYIKCVGVYPVIALYKKALLKGERQKAKKYLFEIFKKKKVIKRKDMLKVLILSLLILIPALSKLYRKYIKTKTNFIKP